MKRNQFMMTLILLILAAVNYSVILHDGSVGAAEFISILVIGILAGILLTQIVQRIKKTKD